MKKSMNLKIESMTTIVDGKREYRIDENTLSVGIEIKGRDNSTACWILEQLELYIESLSNDFDFCCTGCPDWDKEGVYFDWYTIKIWNFDSVQEAVKEFKKIFKSFKQWLKTIDIEKEMENDEIEIETIPYDYYY